MNTCMFNIARLKGMFIIFGFAATMAAAPASSQDAFGVAAQDAGVSPAAVARDTSADTELLLAGDSIVTTATKTAERISDSPAAVTVITQDEIRNSGATTIPELLRSVPGVDVEEPNATQANVSIRGQNQLFANKLLVMVDGRSIYQDIYGCVFWNTEPLLISRIKRIEIVRGPGSVLYGANAFGGVINIITKTPSEMASQQPSATYTVAHGEQNSNFDEATVSTGKSGDWATTVGLGYHGTTGFMPSSPTGAHDGYRVPIMNLDVQKPTPRGSLTLSTSYSDARSDILSGLYVPDAGFHTSDAMLSYVENKGANPITASIYGNFFRISSPQLYVATTSYNAELQQQRTLSKTNELVYGASYRQNGFTATPIGSQRRIESLSALYAQDQLTLDLVTNLFAGVRLDHNSITGSEVSPRVSIVRHLPHNQSLRMSYGMAFRAPTDVEEYLNESIPLTPGLNEIILGNTDLKPEKVASTEIGYRKDLRGGYLGASAFDNFISDEIAYAAIQFAPSPPFPPGTPIVTQYVNHGKAHATGFEIEGGFTLSRNIKGLLNYSFENIIDTTDHEPSDLSPHNKINLVLNDSFGRRWSAYTAVHYTDASSIYAAPSYLRVYTYSTVDARLGYRISPAQQPLTFALSATNLFDDRHTELPLSDISPDGSVQSAVLGRTGWVSLTGKF